MLIIKYRKHWFDSVSLYCLHALHYTNEPIDLHAMPESDRYKCPKTLKLLYEFMYRKENSDIYF